MITKEERIFYKKCFKDDFEHSEPDFWDIHWQILKRDKMRKNCFNCKNHDREKALCSENENTPVLPDAYCDRWKPSLLNTKF